MERHLAGRRVVDRSDKVDGAGELFVGGEKFGQKRFGFRKRPPAGAEKNRVGRLFRCGIPGRGNGQREGDARKAFEAPDGLRRQVAAQFRQGQYPMDRQAVLQGGQGGGGQPGAAEAGRPQHRKAADGSRSTAWRFQVRGPDNH